MIKLRHQQPSLWHRGLAEDIEGLWEPWMRLVDVVDAEASNRASLLFEMRAEHVRQFALYRVIGAQAEQVFQTGTTE